MEHKGPSRCPKNPTPALVQSQMNPFHAPPPFHSFHINSTLRFALFWDITQRRVAIPYRRFGTTYPPQRKGSKRNSLALEDRTHTLSRNVGKELPLCAAQHRRRAQIWTTIVIKKCGECCCRMRSNRKAGTFNTGSGASNLSNSVWHVSTCSV